jgi:hypothetical protein
MGYNNPGDCGLSSLSTRVRIRLTGAFQFTIASGDQRCPAAVNSGECWTIRPSGNDLPSEDKAGRMSLQPSSEP